MANDKLKIKNRGFTLVELLVGMTIFALILGSIAGIFIAGVKLQRKSFAEQEVLNQLSFALEYMSRALRMAPRDESGNCLNSGYSYQNPGGNPFAVKFINHLQQDECQQFFLENGILKYQKGNNPSLALTSPKVTVKELNFYLSGEQAGDGLQPQVTISLKAEAFGSAYPIQLQTTVSQRNLDL